ncbi:kelch-like protein 2 [Melanaphis sacchari]|uniref:kelch-like protein 2 n=1 Tax=Melanaphis sacchari TaxID=742174 RepID=UPI000DC1553F|nr:kelch-like protein 2 [Melanaphis sacchari]
MNALKNSSCNTDQNQFLKPDICESKSYRNFSHMIKVFEVLQLLREDEVFCDIKLQADDGTVLNGHKVVLVSVSPYFRAMFTCFSESNKNVVNIRNLDSTALQLLLDYIYTGEIIINLENVQVLLPASNLLQLEFVRGACIEFLQKQLNPSNCLGIRAFADFYNCAELLSSSEAYIKKQFVKVIEGDEFLSLSSEELIYLISSNDLNVAFEEKVYECVINWVKHELGCRYDSLPRLIKHVRLPLVSLEYITKKVVEEPLFKNIPKCKDYINEALNFHKLKTQQIIIIPQTIHCTPRLSGYKVILMFNLSQKTMKCNTNWYDPATNLLQIAVGVGECNRPSGLAIVTSQFVFSLGSFYMSNSRSVEMFDLFSYSPCWVQMANMLVCRYNLGVGVLDNCIYAIGGSNGTGSLNSAEVFDVNIKKWRMISNMSTKRSTFSVGVLDNLIYAVGGYSGSEILKSVECYDPNLDTWTSVAEMSVGRFGVSIGVLDGVMYAVGGNNGSGHLKNVEAYRPSTGVWSSIADMHLCRFNPGVFALNGLLYVIGGKRGSTCLNSVEIYNPITNTWTIEALPKSFDQIIGGVVVDRLPQFRINSHK